MGVKNLSGAEQLALLNRAGDLVSEANNILCSAGLGVVRSDGHQGHQGALIYPINELRSEVLTALLTRQVLGPTCRDYGKLTFRRKQMRISPRT